MTDGAVPEPLGLPEVRSPFSLDAYSRLKFVLDAGSFRELNENTRLRTLRFPGYPEKLKKRPRRKPPHGGSGDRPGDHRRPAVWWASWTAGFYGLHERSGGGRKITLAMEYATKSRLPSSCFVLAVGPGCEGILSLMQMAKTSAALGRHAQKGLLYIPCSQIPLPAA